MPAKKRANGRVTPKKDRAAAPVEHEQAEATKPVQKVQPPNRAAPPPPRAMPPLHRSGMRGK